MVQLIVDCWPLLVAVLNILVAVPVSAHVVMYKRDPRSAIGWVGLVWLTPLVGALLYFSLGINRIRRRGHRLRAPTEATEDEPFKPPGIRGPWDREPFSQHANIQGLARLVGGLTKRPLLAGNSVEPLVGGDETFPAMLAAIEQAERSVSLCTYIFDTDRIGHRFVAVLSKAMHRGVEVRVLIDDVGAGYSRPRMFQYLQDAGLTAHNFLPTRIPRLFHYANLRNHRKILVADGQVGFTGGTNIREGHQLSLAPDHPVQDVHFRLQGPVVADLQRAFAFDWQFCAEEELAGDTWFPRAEPAGEVWARGISDGPDEDFDMLHLTILGALATARSSVKVVTPYFLPDPSLITALNVAAMRGVEVDIVIPEKNNITLVQWATRAILWQLLLRGCRVWASPPPFDHTKLMLVDGLWTLLGSTNWDPRSLRLNFEFNVECYDSQLCERLTELVRSKIEQAREITLEEVDSRGIPIRIRDGVARLFSPYL